MTATQLQRFHELLAAIERRLQDELALEDQASQTRPPAESADALAGSAGSESLDSQPTTTLTLRDELEAVNGALERIRAGTYGVCARCGREIDVEQLTAIPLASLCPRCQELEEGEQSSAGFQ